MAAGSMAKASTHEKVGTGPLWKTPGEQLPAYIQHVANALKAKHGESKAIHMAVGIIERWKSGGGGVDANTQAAATKAWAEWQALKARHNKGKK